LAGTPDELRVYGPALTAAWEASVSAAALALLWSALAWSPALPVIAAIPDWTAPT
jgi:hypothetical protein